MLQQLPRIDLESFFLRAPPCLSVVSVFRSSLKFLQPLSEFVLRAKQLA